MAETMSLVVAVPAEVKRDIRRNLPWFAAVLGVTVAYVPIMAAVVRVWERDWSFLHACYFTVINMTTVGFGDVVPMTHQGKLVAGLNAFAGLLFFGMLVAVLALALQPTSWSTTLTSTTAPEVQRATEPAEAEGVPHAVADVLDGLSRVIRGGHASQHGPFVANRARIHVETYAPGHVHIDVFLKLDAG